MRVIGGGYHIGPFGVDSCRLFVHALLQPLAWALALLNC
jgi:hypothetical protein